jgi:hypothetical protein
MTLTRTTLWIAVLTLALEGLRAFPSEADSRARTVCEPVHWLTAAATALSSAMNDRGRLGAAPILPWRNDAHASCVRVAERFFRALS